MTLSDQPLTIGIEEEYLLVDPVTRDLVADPPRDLMEECKKRIGADVGNVTPDFLRAHGETPIGSGGFALPGRDSIARRLIDSWLAAVP